MPHDGTSSWPSVAGEILMRSVCFGESEDFSRRSGWPLSLGATEKFDCSSFWNGLKAESPKRHPGKKVGFFYPNEDFGRGRSAKITQRVSFNSKTTASRDRGSVNLPRYSRWQVK